jgi:hypothetical protein
MGEERIWWPAGGGMMMPRLLIHVEGETEETFVNEMLAAHLYWRGYTSVSARLVGNARLRSRRGGIRGWNTVRSDILNHLKEDSKCFATTMVDYYALPQNGPGAWPGRAEAGALPFLNKAATVEDALLADISQELGEDAGNCRFIPYVMMHEFEGLLFSDCEAFGRGIGQPNLTARLQLIRDQFGSPEEVNDSPISAPSKRVMALIPGYQKPLLGVLGVLEIGLDTLRQECPHFREWLERLEGLPI